MLKPDKINVLIVDDIADTRENLRKLLFFERDIEVVGDVARGEEAIQRARELRPDVVLMDINLPGIDGITATEAIRAQLPSVQVIMMSVQGESEYLRRAMLVGAREFLVKPFGSEELASSIRRVHELSHDFVAVAPTNQPSAMPTGENSAKEGPGKLVTVFSTKGGVGRTTVACNLAVALQTQLGKKVALVDCSLQFGDISVLMNIQGNKTIVDLVPHLANLEEEMLDGILTTHSSGVRVLLAPPRPEMAELITADAIKRILGKMRECYDFVVVDTWPSFQDTMLAALDLSDRIVLLFTLEMPAIKNVKLFLEVADALEYPPDKLMLVLNRADSVGGIRLSDVEANLRHRIPLRLVSDGRLAVYALNRGVPFVISNPDTPLAKGVTNLAHFVAGSGGAENANGDDVTGNTKDNGSIFTRLAAPMRLGLRRGNGAAQATSR